MPEATDERPEALVLLATFNGIRWVADQVSSILTQKGASVRIVALDDMSTDGTFEWLQDRALNEPRLTVLPRQGGSGSAAKNFYRLISQVTPDDADLIAFADQDDLWHPDKIARHARLLRTGGHDGVSSSVTSFAPGGRRRLVKKSFPQRRFDFLLESPGPGSTFLITPRLLDLTKQLLDNPQSASMRVEFHDSLIYAVARAHGWTWHIDDFPSVEYRQHVNNVIGANVGVRPALARLRLIRAHWLRNHATLLTRVSLEVAPREFAAALDRMLGLFSAPTFTNRLALARHSRDLRRRPRDQRIIALLITLGVW